MSAKTRKTVYICTAILAVFIILAVIQTRDSEQSTALQAYSGELREKADVFMSKIDQKLPKEKEILSKEADQAKSIDSDKTIINEFNYIFDEPKAE